ncbi:MAG: T9SS type A sorting domain-containing protein, partial [Bacteroidota bacterium]
AVKLNSFDVKAVENKFALVSWNAGNSNGNSFFIVDRSADGISWSAMDTVPGGFSNGYQYTDKSPFAGESYYRLRIITNGQTAYISEIKTVDITGNVSSQPFPNPASGYIIVPEGKANAIIRVADLSGRMHNVTYHSISTGGIQIDVSKLVAGFYFVSAGNAVYSFIKK